MYACVHECMLLCIHALIHRYTGEWSCVGMYGRTLRVCVVWVSFHTLMSSLHCIEPRHQTWLTGASMEFSCLVLAAETEMARTSSRLSESCTTTNTNTKNSKKSKSTNNSNSRNNNQKKNGNNHNCNNDNKYTDIIRHTSPRLSGLALAGFRASTCSARLGSQINAPRCIA